MIGLTLVGKVLQTGNKKMIDNFTWYLVEGLFAVLCMCVIWPSQLSCLGSSVGRASV